MLRGHLAPGAGGHADDQGDVEPAPGHVQQRRFVVHELVEREQADVHGHDLDDRPHPGEGRTDARPDEGGLRKHVSRTRSGPNSSSRSRLTALQP